MAPRWKHEQRRLINRANRAKASAKYPREQWKAWGSTGGGTTWQYRYGTPEERAKYLEEQRNGHSNDGVDSVRARGG